ncbi:MAG: hypothetical protein FWC09_09120 [Lachnospiraceae bacterium]|nr:hypothetical protein [Lachnospiraceae bacterium]
MTYKMSSVIFKQLKYNRNRIIVILSIILISMILVSCSSENSIEQITDMPVDESVLIENTIESNNQPIHEEIIEVDSLEVIVELEEENTKNEISMEDAINIAIEASGGYYSGLKLTRVHSYDNDRERNIESGTDGKREWWYVTFGNEKLNYVIVLIVAGEVVNIDAFDESGNNGLFELSEIKMTSEEAVRKAKELGLRGGNPNNEDEWISGYNFQLSYESLIATPDDKKIFLEVIGISPDGNFARVDFDAMTGELLLAEEKIEHDNGDIEWKGFN